MFLLTATVVGVVVVFIVVVCSIFFLLSSFSFYLTKVWRKYRQQKKDGWKNQDDIKGRCIYWLGLYAQQSEIEQTRGKENKTEKRTATHKTHKFCQEFLKQCVVMFDDNGEGVTFWRHELHKLKIVFGHLTYLNILFGSFTRVDGKAMKKIHITRTIKDRIRTTTTKNGSDKERRRKRKRLRMKIKKIYMKNNADFYAIVNTSSLADYMIGIQLLDIFLWMYIGV